MGRRHSSVRELRPRSEAEFARLRDFPDGVAELRFAPRFPRIALPPPPDHPSGKGSIEFGCHRYAVLLAMICGAFRGEWEWTKDMLWHHSRRLFQKGKSLESKFHNWGDLIKNDGFVFRQQLRGRNAEGAARKWVEMTRNLCNGIARHRRCPRHVQHWGHLHADPDRGAVRSPPVDAPQGPCRPPHCGGDRGA